MKYIIRPCKINNDGSVTEGRHKELLTWPTQLEVGGIYNLRKGRFYRIVAQQAEPPWPEKRPYVEPVMEIIEEG